MSNNKLNNHSVNVQLKELGFISRIIVQIIFNVIEDGNVYQHTLDYMYNLYARCNLFQ